MTDLLLSLLAADVWSGADAAVSSGLNPIYGLLGAAIVLAIAGAVVAMITGRPPLADDEDE